MCQKWFLSMLENSFKFAENMNSSNKQIEINQKLSYLF